MFKLPKACDCFFDRLLLLLSCNFYYLCIFIGSFFYIFFLLFVSFAHTLSLSLPLSLVQFLSLVRFPFNGSNNEQQRSERIYNQVAKLVFVVFTKYHSFVSFSNAARNIPTNFCFVYIQIYSIQQFLSFDFWLKFLPKCKSMVWNLLRIGLELVKNDMHEN